jgi:hypothetical protein
MIRGEADEEEIRYIKFRWIVARADSDDVVGILALGKDRIRSHSGQNEVPKRNLKIIWREGGVNS